MRRKMTKWGTYVAAATLTVAAISHAEAAAPQRVVFNVSGSPTCQGFLGSTTVKSLSIDKNALSDGTFNDISLFVTINFDPNTGSPTEILSWTNASSPPAPSGYTPRKVNAVIVKTGSTASGDTKVAFYPEPVENDPTFAAVLDGTKAINQLTFCHSMTAAATDQGYAACPIPSASLSSTCASLPESSVFVINNLADIARGGLNAQGEPSKPALCACPTNGTVTTQACNPVPGNSDSCIVPGTDVLTNLNSEQQLSTEGSCVLTVCTSFFGRTICQKTTTTSPVPPC
jgi:hypothetical protein